MKASNRTARCAILCRLFEHLEDVYGIDWSRELFVDGQLSLRQIDALLAFKHDAVIDAMRDALERLDAGVYGICIRCKQSIGETLLDLDPSRRVCAACEEEFGHVTSREGSVSAHA